MARVKIREVVFGANGVYAPGATVLVCEPGTSSPTVAGTPLAAPLKSARTGGTTLSNPLTANSLGEVVAWLDAYQQVDLFETYLGATRNVPYVTPEADLADYLKAASPTISSPTINNPTIAGGTASGLTLTTATLTAPVINTPAITGGTLSGGITADAVLPAAQAAGGSWRVRSAGSSLSGPFGTFEGPRIAVMGVLDNDATQPLGCGIYVNVVENTTTLAAGVKTRSAFHANIFTGPDHGESSGALVNVSGGGSGFTGYAATQMRDPTLPDFAYTTQGVLEIAGGNTSQTALIQSGFPYPEIAGTTVMWPRLTANILIGDVMTVGSPGAISISDVRLLRTPGGAIPAGFGGLAGLTNWPTPLYFQIDNEVFSYTGLTGTVAGTATGVIRAVNTTAAAHTAGVNKQVMPVHAGNATVIRFASPIAKGDIYTPIDGLFDTRSVLAIGTQVRGRPTDSGLLFDLQLNGKMPKVTEITCQGQITALNMAATGNLNVTGMAAVGGLTASGTTTMAGAIIRSGAISPTALTANTNDWAPTGLATASIIRAAMTTPGFNLTGISAQPANTTVILRNVGSFPITLVHEATSTAANRFFFAGAANIVLAAFESIQLIYDGSLSRWGTLGGKG